MVKDKIFITGGVDYSTPDGTCLRDYIQGRGKKEYEDAVRVLREGGASMQRVAELCHFLASDASSGITGKLISAVWDNWEHWSQHINELRTSDVYTLRRIAGRDRGFSWGDK